MESHDLTQEPPSPPAGTDTGYTLSDPVIANEGQHVDVFDALQVSTAYTFASSEQMALNDETPVAADPSADAYTGGFGYETESALEYPNGEDPFEGFMHFH